MKKGPTLTTAAKVLGRAGGIASGKARRAKAAARRAAAEKTRAKPAAKREKTAKGKNEQLSLL